MELNLDKYKYTQTWFNGSDIQRCLQHHIDTNGRINMLEIGSHEGLSASCFSDNILNHPESTLDCVDPFCTSDPTTPVTSQTEEYCRTNIAASKNANKCTIHKMFSNDFFKMNTKRFNVIYIDGSHVPEDIKKDMINAYAVLEKGGIMWMDDYGAYHECMEEAMRSLNVYYEVVNRGYQFGIRKLQ